MTRPRTLATALLVFLAAVALGTSASAQDLLNCDDFDSQQEAQDEYNSDTSDPNQLDRDDDGEACETFDYGSTGNDNDDADAADDADDDEMVMPVGGVATGGGGTAPQPTNTAALFGVAAAAGALGAGGVMVRRRTR